MEFDWEKELKELPDKPGVYLMHDAMDHIIYVGKAVVLKNRVRQYFRKSTKKSPKIERMVSQVAWFETIVVDSEAEALVLECNLIKEHRPKYNTMLKDDKGYPYIRVTVGEDFPRIMLARRIKKDDSKYYGPYTNVTAVRDTISLAHKLFRIRDCARKLPEDIGKDRPCLNYHIHQCDAPCQGKITPEEYRTHIRKAQDFLDGKYDGLLSEISQKMQQAAERMDFEAAIALREQYYSVQRLSERQKLSDVNGENRDLVGIAVEGEDAIVQIFFIRQGKLIGRDHFHVRVAEGDDNREILSGFVKQFYSGTPFMPSEIFLPAEIEDEELINSWLSAKAGHKVTIRVPKIGEKHRLMELAENNAQITLARDREKIRREEARTKGAVKELADLIGLTDVVRMEAYDISNISGFSSVASMVVYENGKPKRNDYRKFQIKTVVGANDYASLKEVLLRRFAHGLEETRALEEKGMPPAYGKFSNFPDLILMDGGRGQVNIALEALAEAGVDIPVCGMVKDDNHRTRGLFYNNIEVPMDTSGEAFKLITRIQDEAHRFAITFHRDLRSKEQVHSILDDIPGVGPKRRKALMRTFGGIDALKAAGVEELLAIPEFNKNAAISVYAFFHDGEIPDLPDDTEV